MHQITARASGVRALTIGLRNNVRGSLVAPEIGSGGPTPGSPKRRKFYRVSKSTASRASGFELLNGDKLIKGGKAAFLPAPMIPFRDYTERPVFLADAKLG